MDYQIEELVRDTLLDSAVLQNLGIDMRVYTDHISDIKEKDLEFPCITMHFKGGDWAGTNDTELSKDSIEIEIATDTENAPKQQLDTIYTQVDIILRDETIVTSTYNTTFRADGKPTTMTYYDDKKKRTIYKKTIDYHLVDQDLQ
jgi:hypothetical protein